MYVHAESLQWYDPALLFPGAPLSPAALHGGNSVHVDEPRASGSPSVEAVQREARRRACGNLLDRLAHRTLSSDPVASVSTAECLDALHHGQRREDGCLRAHSSPHPSSTAEWPLRGVLDDVDAGSAHLHAGASESDADGDDGVDLDASLAWFTRGRHGAAAAGAGRGDGGAGSAARRAQAVRDAFQTLPSRLGAQEESVLCPLNTRTDPLAHVVAAAEVFAVVTARVPQTLYVFDQLNAIPISSCVLGGTTYSATGCVTAAESRGAPPGASAEGSVADPATSTPNQHSRSHNAKTKIDACIVAVDDTVAHAWIDPTGHYCVLVFASGACVYYCIPRRGSATAGAAGSGDAQTDAGAGPLAADEAGEDGADAPRRRQQRHREWRAAARRWLRWSRRNSQDGSEDASSANLDGRDAAQAAAAARPRGFSLTLRMSAPPRGASRGTHEGGNAAAQGALVTPSCVGWCRCLPAEASGPATTAEANTSARQQQSEAVCPDAEVLLGAASGGVLVAARLTRGGAQEARIAFRFPSALAVAPVDSVAALRTPPPPLVPAIHRSAGRAVGAGNVSASGPVAAPSSSGAAERGSGVDERDAASASFPTYAHTPHFLCADEEDERPPQAQPPRPACAGAPSQASAAASPPSPRRFQHPPRHAITDGDGALPCRWVVLVSLRNRLYVFSTPPSPALPPTPTSLAKCNGDDVGSRLPPRLTGNVEDAFAACTHREPADGHAHRDAAGHAASPAFHADALHNYLTVEPAALREGSAGRTTRSSPPHRWPPSRVRAAAESHEEEAPTAAPGGTAIETNAAPLHRAASPLQPPPLPQHPLPPPTASSFLATDQTRGTVHLALPAPTSRHLRDGDGGAVVTPAALPAVFYWQYGAVLVQGVVLCGGGGLEVGSRVHQLVRDSVRRATEAQRGDSALESGLRDLLDGAVHATQDFNAWAGAEGQGASARSAHSHPLDAEVNPAARARSASMPPPPSLPSSVLLPIALLSIVNLNTCLQSLQRLLQLQLTRVPAGAGGPNDGKGDRGDAGENGGTSQQLTYIRCAVRATDGAVVERRSGQSVAGGGRDDGSGAGADAALLHTALQFPWTGRLALRDAAAAGTHASITDCHRGGMRVVAVPLLDDALARGDVDAEMRRRLCALATAYAKRSPLLFATPVESALRIAAASSSSAAAPAASPLQGRLRHGDVASSPSSSTRSSTRRRHATPPAEPNPAAGVARDGWETGRGGGRRSTAALPTAAQACAAQFAEAEAVEEEVVVVSVSANYSHIMCTTTAGVYVFAHAAVLPVEEAAQSWRRALVYHAAWPPRRRPPAAATSGALATAGAAAAPPRPGPLFIALADPASPEMFYVASRARIARLQTPSPFTSAAGRRLFVLQLLAAAARRGSAAQPPAATAATRSPSISASPGQSRAWLDGDASATTATAALSSAAAAAAAAQVAVVVPSSLAYEMRLRGCLRADAAVTREDDGRDDEVEKAETALSTPLRDGASGSSSGTPMRFRQTPRARTAAAAAAAPERVVVSAGITLASATFVPDLQDTRRFDSPRPAVSHDDAQHAARNPVIALSAPLCALPPHAVGAPALAALQLEVQGTNPGRRGDSDHGDGSGVDGVELRARASPLDSSATTTATTRSDDDNHRLVSVGLRRAPQHRPWSATPPALSHSFTALAAAAGAPAAAPHDGAFTHRSGGSAATVSVPSLSAAAAAVAPVRRGHPHVATRRSTRSGTAGGDACAAAVAAVVPSSGVEDRELLTFLRANPLLHLMVQRAARLGDAWGALALKPLAAAGAGDAVAVPSPPPLPSPHVRAVNIPGFGVLPGAVGLVPLSPTSQPAVACLLLQSPVGADYYSVDHLFEMALAVCAGGAASRATASRARVATGHTGKADAEVRWMAAEDAELCDVVRHAYGGHLLTSRRFIEAAVQLGTASARGPTPTTTILLELVRAFRECGALEPLLVFLRLRLRSLERSAGGLGGHGLQVSVLTTWLVSLELEACSAARARVSRSEARKDRRTALGASLAGEAAMDLTRVDWIRQRHHLDAPQALLEDTLLRYGRFVDWAVVSKPLLQRLASAPEAVLAAELLGMPGESVVNLVLRQERQYAGVVRLEALLADPTTRAPETRALLRALVRGSAPAAAATAEVTQGPAGAQLLSVLDAVANSASGVDARPLSSAMSPRALASLITRVSPVLLRCYPCRLVENVLRALLEQHSAAGAALSPHRLLPALLTYTRRRNESDFEVNGDVAVVLRALELARDAAAAAAAARAVPSAAQQHRKGGGSGRRHRGLSSPMHGNARGSNTDTATRGEEGRDDEGVAQEGRVSPEDVASPSPSSSASSSAPIAFASTSGRPQLARSVHETRAPAPAPSPPPSPPPAALAEATGEEVADAAVAIGTAPHPTTANLSPVMLLQWGSADELSEPGSVDEDIQLPSPLTAAVAEFPAARPHATAAVLSERHGLFSAVGAPPPVAASATATAAATRRLVLAQLPDDARAPPREHLTSASISTTLTRSSASTPVSGSASTASFDSQLDALIEADGSASSAGTRSEAGTHALFVPGLTPEAVAAALAQAAAASAPLSTSSSAHDARNPTEADVRSATALLHPATQNAALSYLGAVGNGAVARWAGGGSATAADAPALLVAYAGVLARDGAEADLQGFAERVALQHLRALDAAKAEPAAAVADFTAAVPYHLLHVWRLCAARRRWVGCVWVYLALGYHRDAVELALHGVGGEAGVRLAVRLLRLLHDRDVQRERAARVREGLGSFSATSAAVGGDAAGGAAAALTGSPSDDAGYAGDVAYTQQQAVRWSRRALWMLVARHLIYASGDAVGDKLGAQTALQLSLRSGGDHFNLTDVLPELPDHLFMAELQEQLLAAVQELARTMRGLRANTAALGRDTRVLHRELSAIAHAPLTLQVDERCVVCGQPALARPFIMYPRCRHLIHAACYHQARPPLPRPTPASALREGADGVRGNAHTRAARGVADVKECLLCARGRLHRLLDTPLSAPLIGDEVRQPRPRVTLR